MFNTQTEAVHAQAKGAQAKGLDTRPDADVLGLLLDGQISALNAVRPAIPEIAHGVALMAKALLGNGKLAYAGAGSSALMSTADGMELAGTFGTDPGRVSLFVAGGLPQDAEMPGATEDDEDQAARDVSTLSEGDVAVIVTASGSTPYAVRFAQLAQASGVRTICIANNPGVPIFAHADVSICLPTPPEMIAGSTRMGAGTAQKATLNMMSTLMAVRMGDIHDGMMVNVRADNEKLRDRAQRMVSQIAGTSKEVAATHLRTSNGAVKPAILLGQMARLQQNAPMRF